MLAALSFTLLLPLIFYLLPFVQQYASTREMRWCASPASSGSRFSLPIFKRQPCNAKAECQEVIDDNKSAKSFTCTPYVLPYSSEVDVVTGLDVPENAKCDRSKSDASLRADGFLERNEGRWTMVAPPRTAHLA